MLWQSEGTRAKVGINSVWTCGSVTNFAQSVTRWLGSIIQWHLESLNNHKKMFKGQFLIFFQDRKFTWGYWCFSNAVNNVQLVLLFYECSDIRRSFHSFVKLISTTDEKWKDVVTIPRVNTCTVNIIYPSIHLSVCPSVCLSIFLLCILFLILQVHYGGCFYQPAQNHLFILIWLSGPRRIMASPASAQAQFSLSLCVCWSVIVAVLENWGEGCMRFCVNVS